MKKSLSRIGVVSGMVACTLALSTAALAGEHRVRIGTPSLVPDAGGYLQCEVVAASNAPMGIVATIMTDDGTNVTEFSSGFRSSPAANADGMYHAEETAGSLADDARHCKAVVSGTFRRDVRVSLHAFNANGVLIATVEGRGVSLP